MSKKAAHPHQGIADAIRRVSHAIYQGDGGNRDPLKTIRLEVSADRAIALATDGHRISYASSTSPADFPVGKYTIACKPKEAAKIKPAGVAGFVDDSGLQFPDWRNAIPARFDYSATVKRVELLSAIESCERVLGRATAISTAEHKYTAHNLDTEVNLRSMDLIRSSLGSDFAKVERARSMLASAKAKLAHHNEEGPKADSVARLNLKENITMEARGYYAALGGESFEVATEARTLTPSSRSGECRDTIGIDVRYLGEAVRAATGETITIESIDAWNPIRISDGDGWELIMPMRLR